MKSNNPISLASLLTILLCLSQKFKSVESFQLSSFVQPPPNSHTQIDLIPSTFINKKRILEQNGRPSPFIKSRKWYSTISTNIENKVSIQRSSGSIQKKLRRGGGIFSPYEILYPSFETSHERNLKENRSQANKSLESGQSSLPLFAAIEVLSNALRKIIKSQSFSATTIANNQNITIRIDQLLHLANSDSTDALLWLRECSASPKVYFQDSQKSLEVAGYGTSSTFLLTGDYQLVESDWDIISSLPPGIKVYGGGRFDPMLPVNKRGEEWQGNGYGGYYYMLPSVEMRKEDGKTYLSVNLHGEDIQQAAKNALNLLKFSPTSSRSLRTSPPPLLQPILFRNEDTPSEEEWERAIHATLDPTNNVNKTVLSRKVDLFFQNTNGNVQKRPLDMLWRMKLAGHVGHFFYLEPSLDSGAFWGCTPERLFSIDTKGKLQSEALAGTRTRGSDISSDEALTSELLFSSPKDMTENSITKKYICDILQKLKEEGLVNFSDDINNGKAFVRRLRNLQHICQNIQADLTENSKTYEVTKALLESLHPTPAVCGFPKINSLQLIREHEVHDRGYYAGPFGYIGSDCADILVAIRSALFTSPSKNEMNHRKMFTHRLSVYAGAGIVDGSTPQGEWTETSHKLGVISSLFSPAMLTLDQAPTANMAFSTVFIEELIRCGITMFYVCPGSRSTPLTAAIAKAVKTTKNLGIIRAVSVHDERGAAYRAIGYARRTGRPAVVVTSSGTAVGNLYPAVMEADEDGVPIVLLTADRPYEARCTGANQAIDQVKVFGSLVRWFRDIPSPSDDAVVSISPALSDANHAVLLSKTLLGPVHINIQFRENLAPEGGLIRGDNRMGSISHFNSRRYTDVPGFHRWASVGTQWQQSYKFSSSASSVSIDPEAVRDVASLIINSKRGLIVVGNVRVTDDGANDQCNSAKMISHFASSIGFPVFASIMSGSLRNGEHTPVVPCSEHLLKNKKVSKNMRPDLILQIGAPILSTEINDVKSTMIREQQSAAHVLIHPHSSIERADPDFTATHVISAFAPAFLQAVLKELDLQLNGDTRGLGSELAPLVIAGRALRDAMTEIIHDASSHVMERHEVDDLGIRNISGGNDNFLTEPQLILAISEVLEEEKSFKSSLFLSNSMPVRDAEFFMYPKKIGDGEGNGPRRVGVNRGASGIDGIISAATGFLDGNWICDQQKRTPEAENIDGTTLLIGDLASLHDINALHGIGRAESLDGSSSHSTSLPLTTVVVNNNGGGIFSFLPVAKYASEVGFEEFFGTATDSFSFEDGAKAFGLAYEAASTYQEFKESYRKSIKSGTANLLEARVVNRSKNVEVHKEITDRAIKFIDGLLTDKSWIASEESDSIFLPIETHIGSAPNFQELYNGEIRTKSIHDMDEPKTVVLLHGWMGSKSDWNETAELMAKELPRNWKLLALDMPGHGGTKLMHSSAPQLLRSSLNVNDEQHGLQDSENIEPLAPKTNTESHFEFSVNIIAHSVLRFLSDINVTRVDAICGYSLGGRVALAMKRISTTAIDENQRNILKNSKVMILSSYPGKISQQISNEKKDDDKNRVKKDRIIAKSLLNTFYRSLLLPSLASNKIHTWGPFLSKWYAAPIWGSLQDDDPSNFGKIIAQRVDHLSKRACDLAVVLQSCSPPLNPEMDWKYVNPNSTLFVSGSLDEKYTEIGDKWSSMHGVSHLNIPNAGHALLVQDTEKVAESLSHFILGKMEQNETARIEPEKELSNKEIAIPISPSFELLDKSLAKPNTENMSFEQTVMSAEKRRLQPSPTTFVKPAFLDFEVFNIELFADNKKKGVSGIGWGDVNGKVLNQRVGYILQMISSDNSVIGVGEISPLPALHLESFEEAGEQLRLVQDKFGFDSENSVFIFEANSILALDGSLTSYVDSIAVECGLVEHGKIKLFPSVRSGLEMAILALASQVVGKQLPHAIVSKFTRKVVRNELKPLLPLNGLITKGSSILSLKQRWSITKSTSNKETIEYSSLKLKIGRPNVYEDVQTIRDLVAFNSKCMIRCDANRAWDSISALTFASTLKQQGFEMDKIEFVEEPLKKVVYNESNGYDKTWDIAHQIIELDSWSEQTGLFYALDESLVDLALMYDYDFDLISKDLMQAMDEKGLKGCSALILKPAILGLELSMRIAKLAKQELGLDAIFSASFDSGVGLAHCAFMAACADTISPKSKTKRSPPHGLGTFDMLAGDTLTPSFGSYVNEKGMLNVASLARAFYGLGLDELRESISFDSEYNAEKDLIKLNPHEIKDYESASSTSSSGREVNVQVSLPLPFSDTVASSSFTDLQQQSRFSPWISSVDYIPEEGETEWKLNVRGIQFTWRAVSFILNDPKGISWESVSGVKNKGKVEFIPTSKSTCVMTVKMRILKPRLLASLFRGTSVFLEDYLQNKLLKWSLEMFRDVVRADLALKRGDAELGDALFSAAEGRANAIEATLSTDGMNDRGRRK